MLDLMEPPNTRAEFERRIFLLAEQLRCGKLHFHRRTKMSVLGKLDPTHAGLGRALETRPGSDRRELGTARCAMKAQP